MVTLNEGIPTFMIMSRPVLLRPGV